MTASAHRLRRGTGSLRRSTSHRTDIDGLRGFAIMLVVLFHVYVGRVSSGVDVFLLVGGIFFFAPQLRNAVDPRGTTVLQSVIRLLRRLFPALAVVVAATVALGTLVLDEVHWRSLGAEAVASLTYRLNLHLAHRGQSYAAVSDEVSPLQHLWSMSAQMQVYLASLVVIVLLGWCERRFGWRRHVARGVLVGATVLSFVYAAWLHGVNQDDNYFSPVARFWEIGLGGIFGLWLMHVVAPRAVRQVMGVVGLALIVGTGLFLDGARQFPGPWTLVPLCGAMLVVLAGNHWEPTPPPTVATALLESRPFQTLGRISYALYLWHWPILVLLTTAFGRPSFDLTVGFLVIVLSLVLAYVTHRWVEVPLRQGRRPRRSWVVADAAYLRDAWRAQGKATGAAVVVLLAVLVLAFPVVHTTVQTRTSHQLDAESRDAAQYPGARAFLDDAPVPPVKDVVPLISNVENMLPATQADGCFSEFDGTDIVLTHDMNRGDTPCAYGDRSSDRTLYLVGGSHSEHYLPALDIIGRARGVKIVPLLKMGCVLGVDLPRFTGEAYPECARWRADVERYIHDNPPTQGVFMTSTRPTTLQGNGPDLVPEGYREAVRRLTGWGIHTWGVRDTPWLMAGWREQKDGRACVAAGRGPAECGTRQDAALAPVDPAPAAYAGLDITTLDVTDALCRDGVCPAVIGNVLVYRDTQHMTSTFAETLAGELDRRTDGLGTGAGAGVEGDDAARHGDDGRRRPDPGAEIVVAPEEFLEQQRDADSAREDARHAQ
ncbi:acyltransferase [Corynebacterium bovis]|uniref:acyltransferase family protein n=1 Tax=Corynebacterium bovis TaxID=36808 RepID=UPI00313982E5